MKSAGRGKGRSTKKMADPTLLLKGNAVHLMSSSWSYQAEKHKRRARWSYILVITLLAAILGTYLGGHIKIT